MILDKVRYDKLSNIDKYVLSPLTKKREFIEEIDYIKFKSCLNDIFILLDIRYLPSNDEIKSLLILMKRMYSKVALQEIKIAFDIAITGNMQNIDLTNKICFKPPIFFKVLQGYYDMQHKSLNVYNNIN